MRKHIKLICAMLIAAGCSHRAAARTAVSRRAKPGGHSGSTQ